MTNESNLLLFSPKLLLIKQKMGRPYPTIYIYIPKPQSRV